MPEAVSRMCSVKKVFLKISQNSQKDTWSGVSFFIKLQVFYEAPPVGVFGMCYSGAGIFPGYWFVTTVAKIRKLEGIYIRWDIEWDISADNELIPSRWECTLTKVRSHQVEVIFLPVNNYCRAIPITILHKLIWH